MTPLSEACLDVRNYMAIARLFRTADDLLDHLAGPAQHDAHVQAYRHERWFQETRAQYRVANEAVAAEVDKIIAEWKQA